jgi:hypothetical protein
MTILQAFSILLSLFGADTGSAGSLSIPAIAREMAAQVETLAPDSHFAGVAYSAIDVRQPLAGIKPI